jgi:peptide deformylase
MCSEEPQVDGSELAVVRAPATILSRRSAEVDPQDPAVVQLAADLVATMRVSPGCVGLAAPQVGVDARVFVLDVTGHPKTRSCAGLVVMINPIVEDAGAPQRGREGCMSVPDFTGDVARPRTITVTGLLPGNGRSVTVIADRFEARAFGHEIDHLDGLLFLDRLTGANALHPRQRYL